MIWTRRFFCQQVSLCCVDLPFLAVADDRHLRHRDAYLNQKVPGGLGSRIT